MSMRLSAATFLMAASAFHSAYAGEWDYSATRDKMTGKVSAFASITSDDSLDLEPPFEDKNGLNRGTLYASKAGVSLAVYKGIMNCRPFGAGCVVQAKFDDGPVRQFAARGDSDGDKTWLHIRPFASFLQQLEKSNRVMIRFSMFRDGTQTLEFRSDEKFSPSKLSSTQPAE